MKSHLMWMMLAGMLVGPLGFLVGRAFPAATADEELLRQLVREHGEQLTALSRQELRRSPCSMVGTLSPADGAAIRADLARLVREELHGGAGGAAAQAPEQPRSEKARAEEPSSDSVAAVADAHQVLENALGARRWTEREAETLRLLLPRMTDGQRQEVTQRLAAAINSRHVSVEVIGPPY